MMKWNHVRLAIPVLLSLAVACSSVPRVSTDAPGSLLEVSRIAPATSWWLIVPYTRSVKTTFWLFAEDALDFRVFDVSGRPLEEVGTRLGEETVVFSSYGPNLVELGGINGQPVSFHGGSLLIGRRDLGPIESGDTVEFTRDGVFIAGVYRGKLPKP